MRNTVNSKNFLYIHAFCDIIKLQIVLRYLTFIVIGDDGIMYSFDGRQFGFQRIQFWYSPQLWRGRIKIVTVSA